MKIERTKNAARNLLFDGLLKVLNTVVPFFMRMVMLHFLGVEYLGLNGLFRSILSFLNLAELGVGSAMVFSMYRPIAEDDAPSICALLRLYRTFYRVIGLFIAVAGLALTPFLPGLIHGTVPQDMNLHILYFMYLGNTVLTYWLFAYKRSLLDAHQRLDVASKVHLCIRMVEYGLKFLSLMVFRNYYVFLAVQLVAQTAINIIISLRVSKLYPAYIPRGKLPREKVMDIVRRVRDLFTSRLSAVVFNYADTLVISAFMGLTALAVYQNYFFVITALRTFLETATAACIAGVGNSLVTETEEKNYRDLVKLTMLFCWMMCVSTALLLCMFQPFMQLWMGKEYLLSVSHVVCFAIYYYSMGVNKLVNMFKDAAGIWRKDRWRPLTAALVNLVLNLATVQWLGLYGVLLSSVISIVLVQIPWLFRNLFQEVFPRKHLWEYVRLFSSLAALAFLSCVVSWTACSLFHLGAWPSLLVNAALSFLISNSLFLAVYSRNRTFVASVKAIGHTVLKGRGMKRA